MDGKPAFGSRNRGVTDFTAAVRTIIPVSEPSLNGRVWRRISHQSEVIPAQTQSGLTFTLRNSIFQPSASSPTYPRGTSHSCHSQVTAPLTQRVMSLPLQVIS